jgi:hypothetical protein
MSRRKARAESSVCFAASQLAASNSIVISSSLSLPSTFVARLPHRLVLADFLDHNAVFWSPVFGKALR